MGFEERGTHTQRQHWPERLQGTGERIREGDMQEWQMGKANG
jgi:hypothetical protein